MNIEIDQQQKFTEEFSKLARQASTKFMDKWDGEVRFVNPTHIKMSPELNTGAFDLLSVDLKNKFVQLRDRYFAKSL